MQRTQQRPPLTKESFGTWLLTSLGKSDFCSVARSGKVIIGKLAKFKNPGKKSKKNQEPKPGTRVDFGKLIAKFTLVMFALTPVGEATITERRLERKRQSHDDPAFFNEPSAQ